MAINNPPAGQTGAEIKALYEVEANAYTDAKDSKLGGIDTGATVDQTGAEIKSAYESESDTNAFTDSEKAKLAGSVGATIIKSATISDPNGYYDQRSIVPLFRADAAMTTRRIHILGPNGSPGAELDIDLYYADDWVTGSLANAVLIQQCDTTSGVFTKTSGFTVAAVPSGKYVYFSFGAQPHVDWLDLPFEIYFTYD